MKKIVLVVITLVTVLFCSPYIANTIYSSNQELTINYEIIMNNIVVLLLINISFYAVEIIRFKILSHILKLKLTFQECFYAIALNLFFGWLTPSSFLGAPASAYYLYKKGIGLQDSLILSFIRSFTIILTSSLGTVITIGLNIQGESHIPEYGAWIYKILIGLAIYIFGLITLCFFPEKFLRKYEILYSTTQKIKFFITNGFKYFPFILILSLITNFLLVGFVFYMGKDFTNDLTELIGQTYLFLSYLLLAPTPGATGLAEIGGPLFFGKEIPLLVIISSITSMRIATFFLQITIGFVVMLFMLKTSINFDKLKAFKNKVN